MADGITDFSSLTAAELASAKARIDPILSPIDYDKVRGEIARRNLRRRTKLLPIMLRVLGTYLLLGGLVALGTFISLLSRCPKNAAPIAVLSVALMLAVVITCAGALLITKRRLGIYFGIIALSFQVVSFSTGTLGFAFVPLYAAQLSWAGGDLGFHLFTGPRFNFHYMTAAPPNIAVDVVAIYGLILLARACRVPRRAR